MIDTKSYKYLIPETIQLLEEDGFYSDGKSNENNKNYESRYLKKIIVLEKEFKIVATLQFPEDSNHFHITVYMFFDGFNRMIDYIAAGIQTDHLNITDYIKDIIKNIPKKVTNYHMAFLIEKTNPSIKVPFYSMNIINISNNNNNYSFTIKTASEPNPDLIKYLKNNNMLIPHEFDKLFEL